MLRIPRRPGESFTIDLQEGIDPNTPIGELFANGPILVAVKGPQQTGIAIAADRRFRILRSEVRERDNQASPTRGRQAVEAVVVRQHHVMRRS